MSPMPIRVPKSGPAKKRPRGSAKARRTAARLAAVQVLYQVMLIGAKADEALAEFIQDRIGHEVDGATFVPADITLLTAIVRGADAERERLNRAVQKSLDSKLERDRLEMLLQAILLAGTWELLRNLETPAAIILAEYVGVAGGFYGGTEPNLVNAVLDRTAHTLRPYEFGATGPGAIPGGPEVDPDGDA